MVVDLFESILQELGNILQLKLHPDRHHSCLVKLNEDVNVQIEVDHSGLNLVIGTDLGPVPPGKYRENLFREALRSNGMPSPRNGILAYSNQSGKLVLFEILPLKDLTGQKVATLLTPFAAKAKLWKEALARGDVPVITPTSRSSGSGMFGLR